MTPAQVATLEAVAKLQGVAGRSITQKSVVTALGHAQSAVFHRLMSLEAKGLIASISGRPGTTRLTERGWATLACIKAEALARAS